VWRRCRCNPHSRPRRHPPESCHRPTHRQARPGNSLKHHRFCRRLAIRTAKDAVPATAVHPRRASRHFAPAYDAAHGSRRVTADGQPRSARVRHPSVRVVGRTGGGRRHRDHRTDSDGSSRWQPLAWDLPHGPAMSHSSGLRAHHSTGGPADRSAGALSCAPPYLMCGARFRRWRRPKPLMPHPSPTTLHSPTATPSHASGGGRRYGQR